VSDINQAEYSYSIRREPRHDGLFFWRWEVINNRRMRVAFGTCYTSGSASKEAQSALLALTEVCDSQKTTSA
jgi:hypothetical protein